jgi:hypothetical protein
MTKIIGLKGKWEDRYTPEQIYHDSDGWLTLGNDRLEELLARALSKAPKAVVDWIGGKCLFVMLIGDNTGCTIPKDKTRNKSVIVLSEKLLEEDTESVARLILHEVAHVYHKHGYGPRQYEEMEEHERQEGEADYTAALWLGDRREQIG